jgi:ABC-type antimicrobial peptide transport system permease subunit
MFAVLGPLLLVLAAIGVYAVVAYTVSLRTSEIGVRAALGATSRRLIAEIVGENVATVLVGALVGWLAAFLVALDFAPRMIAPSIFAGVPALLLAVAAVAAWIPARRAARVDPMTALRSP